MVTRGFSIVIPKRPIVITGLDPVIHSSTVPRKITGSSPVMTRKGKCLVGLLSVGEYLPSHLTSAPVVVTGFSLVITGLDPVIHSSTVPRWITGSSPVMTGKGDPLATRSVLADSSVPHDRA